MTPRIILGVALLFLLPAALAAAPIIYPINAQFPVVLALDGTDPTDAVRITLDIGLGPGPGQVVSPDDHIDPLGWARSQPELSTVAPGVDSPIVVRMSLADDPSVFADYVVPLDPTLASYASQALWAHYILEGTGLPGKGRFNPVLAHVPGTVGRHELTGTFAVRAYVPEPAAFSLLVLAAVAGIARRHLRRVPSAPRERRGS